MSLSYILIVMASMLRVSLNPPVELVDDERFPFLKVWLTKMVGVDV